MLTKEPGLRVGQAHVPCGGDGTLLPEDGGPAACQLDVGERRERLSELKALFDDAYLGRARTATGVRLRFRARTDVRARLHSLAARERACCPRVWLQVNAVEGELVCDVSTTPEASAWLDFWYALPDAGTDCVTRRPASSL